MGLMTLFSIPEPESTAPWIVANRRLIANIETDAAPFYEAPRARNTDPDTSHRAASDASRKAQTNRELALATLRAHPTGLTDFELSELTGVAQTSIGKRRGELRDAGLVIDSGNRRPSPSGSAAIVWTCSPNAIPNQR